MRKTRLILCLLLSAALYTVSALAAETAGQTDAPATNKLESISPATVVKGADDCPMHKGEKEKCKHKHGEPCPYHEDSAKHHE